MTTDTNDFVIPRAACYSEHVTGIFAVPHPDSQIESICPSAVYTHERGEKKEKFLGAIKRQIRIPKINQKR